MNNESSSAPKELQNYLLNTDHTEGSSFTEVLNYSKKQSNVIYQNLGEVLRDETKRQQRHLEVLSEELSPEGSSYHSPANKVDSIHSQVTIKSSINDEDGGLDQFDNQLENSYKGQITEENESKEQTLTMNTSENNNQ